MDQDQELDNYSIFENKIMIIIIQEQHLFIYYYINMEIKIVKIIIFSV